MVWPLDLFLFQGTVSYKFMKDSSVKFVLPDVLPSHASDIHSLNSAVYSLNADF